MTNRAYSQLSASLVPFFLTALAAVACSCGGALGRRTGPDFSVAFPDASVLVTTNDPPAVRSRLAEVRLPATPEHHQQLVDLLRAQPTISAAHLLLLVEAVALPENNATVVSDGHTVHAYTARGDGKYANVVDQLITAGTAKLTDVDRRWLGELLGRTQSDAALRTLADRFVPTLDDGSEGALIEMLAGMPGSPALKPFLTNYLAPQGRLDGPRGWAVVDRLSFDHDRIALIEVLAARQPSIDGARVLATIETMDFDEGRQKGLALLAAKARPLSADVARSVVATFSFDEGRQAAVATLANEGGLQLDEEQLVSLVKLCSFDSGRQRCVQLLAPRLQGSAETAPAKALLDAFSFDEDRLAALRIMAPRWRELPVEARRSLCASFSFESGRTEASTALMR